MERKKKSKRDEQIKSQRVAKPVEPLRKADESDDSIIDYGGIPARDLKKNLGCGS